MRKALYARSAVKNDEAIKAQLREIKKACKGYRFAEYIDDGESGMDNNRPALKKLLSDAKKKVFDTLYIRDFSRLARSNNILEKILGEFRKRKVRIVSVKEGSELPFGYKMLNGNVVSDKKKANKVKKMFAVYMRKSS